jgi:hypothetical protein
MDYSKAALVVCLTLVIVIGFNIILYVSATRDKSAGTIELLRRASQRARNPWENEDTDLEELSRIASTLRNKVSGEKDQS